MGAMKELSIDIENRKGRSEWALILDDEKRPATLWRIIGETKGKYFLAHSKIPGLIVVEPVENCWPIA